MTNDTKHKKIYSNKYIITNISNNLINYFKKIQNKKISDKLIFPEILDINNNNNNLIIIININI